MPEAEGKLQRVPRRGKLIMPPNDSSDTEHPRQSRSKATPPKAAGWLAYTALILLSLACYSPIFLSGLLWSEYDQIERSSYQSMEAWTDAWTLEIIRTEDPITLNSYFIEQKIPFAPSVTHHAINLLLHIAAAILLLKNLEALKLSAAFSAALVFALHPTVLQTIFWSGYREELIGLILILAALYFGLRNRNLSDFMILTVICVIAYISHPAGIVIPLLLGLCIFQQNRSFKLKDYNRLLPLLCLALFIGVWTQGSSAVTELEWGERLGISTQNLFFYLKQALFPFELALFHPFDQSKAFSVSAQSSFLPLLLFIPFYILVTINFRKTWARGILLGLTAYLLLVIYGLSQVGAFIDGSLALEDHFQYVALPIIIALVICTAGGVMHHVGLSGKVLWHFGFTLFAGTQMLITASYAYNLSDRTQMWYQLTEQWPNAWLPKYALIDAIEKSGQKSDLLSNNETIKMLEDILDQQPNLIEVRKKLLRIYHKEGQNTNALRQYKRILRDSEPSNEFLLEAAELYDRLGLTWDAKNARERITQ
jgi:tetratricopeptide (TPR) repeat protein